jgi:hypothetical protein
MSGLTPVFALNPGDVVWLILVILFVVVPAVGQLLLKMGKQGQQQRPGGGRPPGKPPGGAVPRGPARGGLEDEIGEFLRRAAQHRQGQPARPPRPVARPAMAPPVAEKLVMAEVVVPRPLGEGIKQHVGEYLDAAEFRRRAAELGEEVAQADEQVEQRLHARFDHEVSSLAGTPGESAGMPTAEQPPEPEYRANELPSAAAAGLAAMLGDAVGIRQAIVINEILTRPEDRWT